MRGMFRETSNSGCYGTAKPGFGKGPVAHNSARRNGENFRCLLNAQSAEKTQFNDLDSAEDRFWPGP